MKYTKREKELRALFEGVDGILWMAIRYAHGRHTYAPQIVRDAVAKLKQIFPDFKVRRDIVIIENPRGKEPPAYDLSQDYLNDLMPEEEERLQ